MFEIYYGISSLILSVLLYFPVKKFVLVYAANRQMAKLKRNLTEEELAVIEKRSKILGAILAVTFAFVFNKVMLLRLYQAGM